MSAPWYSWFPGDYLRDTQALSWEEDLALRKLLDNYYSNGAPIQHDRRHRMTGAVTPKQKAAVDLVLAQFFKRDGDRWRNARADRELERRGQFRTWGQEGGRRSGEMRKCGNPPSTLP